MRKYLLIITVCLCMAPSCGPKESDTFHRKVKVTNNSDIPIYITFALVSQGAPLEFPWNENQPKVKGAITKENRCDPGDTNRTAISTIRPSDSIEDLMRANNRKMIIYFVDAERYDALPIGEPLYDELLLDQRTYQVDDLRAINFHVVYPLE